MKKFFSTILFLITFSQLNSQVPFDQNPNWISTDVISVSTGGAFADIDKDGWLDFVVANGNDISIQKLVIYYNNGNGTFPSTPNWQATDSDYHGHLDVGDVNGDGWPDVAVSVYTGTNTFSLPGKVKLYLNNNGTLSSNPDWISGDQLYTFSCAFGDADGDGDLDLAVAGGEAYTNKLEKQRIYFNDGGMLESLPSWSSTSTQFSYDVEWADFDNDGDLDIVFNGEGNPNRIFENVNGTISLTPIWQSTDASQYANSLFVGDVNNDGYLDLAISDNSQLGGSGKFKIYLNNNGTLNTTPFWTSAFSGYGSGIYLADIDNDIDLDLLTGAWFDTVRIYINNNGNFTTNYNYKSSTRSVVEVIVMGDVDKDAMQDVQEVFISDSTKKLFYLQRTPVQEIKRVIVDSDTLQYNQYCYDLENGWISLSTQPDSGANILIVASVSWDLDIGVTNWDQNIGNYLFLNTSDPVFVANEENLPEGFVLYQNYPNPFNPSTKIKFTIPNVTLSEVEGSLVTLKVYDVLGNEVATLVDDYKLAGEYEVEFNAAFLPSSVYFYQLNAGNYISTKKMLLLK